MNELSSIQVIKEIIPHNNADTLEIAKVLGYEAIVKKNEYKIGDLICFIFPDVLLPEKPWSAVYRSKSGRVKSIKLRGVWSFGIVESLNKVGYNGEIIEGLDISDAIGVRKWEPPIPQDLQASGPFGLGIARTDESRWQSLSEIPYGEICDLTLKIDGKSVSFIYNKKLNIETGETEITRAVGGRNWLYKPDCQNDYNFNERQFKVLEKLERFCNKYNVNLCVRGECFGLGVQAFENNPHSKESKSFALYSTWLIDERRYARKGEQFYIHNIAKELDLPTVPTIERDVILTPELIKKYSEDLQTINGKPFEGIVVQTCNTSFKIINLSYDSKK